MPLHTKNELLQKLANGDESAFNQLYCHYSATIFNTAMRYLKEEETAKEVVQLVFIRLWNSRATLANVQDPEDYIFILTRNLVFDHFKKVAFHKKLLAGARAIFQTNAQVNDSGHLVEEHEYGKLLQTAINQLPPRQREVYLLYHDKGLSYEEIANNLHVSRLTIKKHLELARGSLRNYITVRHSSWLFILYLVAQHL